MTQKHRLCPFYHSLQPVSDRFGKSLRQKLLRVHNNGEYCKSEIPSFSDVPRESSCLLETALSRMFEISPQLFCKDQHAQLLAHTSRFNDAVRLIGPRSFQKFSSLVITFCSFFQLYYFSVNVIICNSGTRGLVNSCLCSYQKILNLS